MAPTHVKALKKSAEARGLATVDALLSTQNKPHVEKSEQRESDFATAEIRSEPVIHTAKQPSTPSPAPTPAPVSRLGRCLDRAHKGELGPIRVSELALNPLLCEMSYNSGAVAAYEDLLKKNPHVQPGRPLVNICGESDETLSFQLLTLHELVLAARNCERDILQVMLVRLESTEAEQILQSQQPKGLKVENATISPRDIAQLSGFMQLRIADIRRSENTRARFDTESPDFAMLVESIRVVGLQNPPVIEVRPNPEDNSKDIYVCISGHRRLMALEALGEENVTCALKTFASDQQRVLASLVENINRADLHFLDKADGFGALTQLGMAGTEISALLETDPRTVNKYLRASAWDNSVKLRVRDLGPKLNTRFLLNTLAAGIRTTEELMAMIEKHVAPGEKKETKSTVTVNKEQLRARLNDFYTQNECHSEARELVEKALTFLGLM